MDSPLKGIYVPKALSTEAAAFEADWESGRLAEATPGLMGARTVAMAKIKGKGTRRSFAGVVRMRVWVSMSEGSRMAVAVPMPPEPPKPFRFKASLRLVGIEVS